MNLLIIGATGMLGNTMLRFFAEDVNIKVYGTARDMGSKQYFSEKLAANIIIQVDVENHDSLVRAFAESKPDIVINCVGVVKQLASANDTLQSVPINTLLPHRLAALCQATNARLIQISTDCVFSGKRGGYTEADFPDAYDLYGRSKLLGEVDYPNAITLRTSIIGHELSGSRSLICWFLAQERSVKGFTKAIYSGFPTVEIARIIKNFVIPKSKMRGLYHVASNPINKYDLLKLVAKIYGKTIEIVPSEELVIDRSLNADRFNQEVGYKPPEWSELVELMHKFK